MSESDEEDSWDGVKQGGQRWNLLLSGFARLGRAGATRIGCVTFDADPLYMAGKIEGEMLHALLSLLAEAGDSLGLEPGPFEVEVHTEKWRYLVVMGPHAAWVAGLPKPVAANTTKGIRRAVQRVCKQMLEIYPKAHVIDCMEQLIEEGLAEVVEDHPNPFSRSYRATPEGLAVRDAGPCDTGEQQSEPPTSSHTPKIPKNQGKTQQTDE